MKKIKLALIIWIIGFVLYLLPRVFESFNFGGGYSPIYWLGHRVFFMFIAIPFFITVIYIHIRILRFKAKSKKHLLIIGIINICIILLETILALGFWNDGIINGISNNNLEVLYIISLYIIFPVFLIWLILIINTIYSDKEFTKDLTNNSNSNSNSKFNIIVHIISIIELIFVINNRELFLFFLLPFIFSLIGVIFRKKVFSRYFSIISLIEIIIITGFICYFICYTFF